MDWSLNSEFTLSQAQTRILFGPCMAGHWLISNRIQDLLMYLHVNIIMEMYLKHIINGIIIFCQFSILRKLYIIAVLLRDSKSRMGD